MLADPTASASSAATASSARGGSRYPPAVVSFNPRSLFLDGEVAVYDQQLAPLRLAPRFALGSRTLPVLIAFDVLYIKGRDISQRPLQRGERGWKTYSPTLVASIRCDASRSTVWTPGSA